MDLRLSKRAPTDDLLELYNIRESPEDTSLYESPALEKRDNMLRLSKRDLLRLSKRDLLRLSKRDLLRLSKRAEEARNALLFLSFGSSLWSSSPHLTPRIPDSCSPLLLSSSVTKNLTWQYLGNQVWYHRSADVKTTG